MRGEVGGGIPLETDGGWEVMLVVLGAVAVAVVDASVQIHAISWVLACHNGA